MCDVLNLPTSTYYYHTDFSSKRTKKAEDLAIFKEIKRIFKGSRNNYGTRRIKKELAKLPEPKHVSCRRIGRLMNELGLVSNYTVAQFKLHKSSCNEAPVKNTKSRINNAKTPVDSITYLDCKQFVTKLTKKLKSSRKIIFYFSRILKEAVQLELITKNPMTGIELPSEKNNQF